MRESIRLTACTGALALLLAVLPPGPARAEQGERGHHGPEGSQEVATRIYLPSTAENTTILPEFDAGWDGGRKATRRKLASLTRTGTPLGPSVPEAHGGGAAGHDEMVSQYILEEPLPAGEISGTIEGQISVKQNASSNNYHAQMSVRVVSSDGLTGRGSLLALDEMPWVPSF